MLMADACMEFHWRERAAEPPLPEGTLIVAVVGATASGKTAASLAIAEAVGGEIVNVDKRVATDLEIGTAAPRGQELLRAPHHMVGVFGSNQIVPRSLYREMAQACIGDIVERGKVPVLVGGPPSLMESLLYDVANPVGQQALKAFNRMTDEQLMEYCAETPGVGFPFELTRQRLIKHILGRLALGRDLSQPPPPGTVIVGMYCSHDQLDARIKARAAQMMADGLEAELGAHLERTGGYWSAELKEAIGYGDFHPYVRGNLTPEESIVRRTRAYAFWQVGEILERLPHTRWVSSAEEAVRVVTTAQQKT